MQLALSSWEINLARNEDDTYTWIDEEIYSVISDND